MQLITTKPTIYLVNLTMKDYLRQKSKYLPLIAKWVTEHGGLPRDIIPFSIEFEEKVYSFKGDKEGLEEWLKENGGGKVRSRLEKIVTEGFTKFGLQYYFTGELFPSLLISQGKMNMTDALQLARRKFAAGLSRGVVLLHRRQVPFMAISSAALSKRKLWLTRTSMICVKVVRVWGRLKPRASIGRREEAMRSKMVSCNSNFGVLLRSWMEQCCWNEECFQRQGTDGECRVVA